MKLLLMSDEGTILDSTDEFTRDEWDALLPQAAWALLGDMNADAR